MAGTIEVPNISLISQNGEVSQRRPSIFKITKDVEKTAAPDEGVKRNIHHATSDFETMIHLLKGNIGTGCLAMPEAFMHAGLWVGLAGIPFLGFFCIHCMHLILQCSRELCRRGKFASLSYEETAEMSFKLGPPWAQKWQNVVATTVTTFLIITQIGFCCVYYVFVAQNIYQVVTCMTGNDRISQFEYMIIILIPLLLICYIPNLKYLAPVSLMASILQAVGIIIILYYLVRDLPVVEMAVPWFGGWSGLPLYFGTALFAFEAIGLVLPLENNMKHPNSFPGLTGVLNSGMLLVICIYASVGFFGYLRYGDTAMGSITLNLPGDEHLAQVVKMMMAAAIFFSYPLQFYVPVHILLPSVVNRFSSKRVRTIAEYMFRSTLVLFTFILAALIPNIGLFINLVGCISSTGLALIFPPIVDTVTFWPDTGKYNWKLCKNIFIVSFGLMGFTTGAYASIKALVEFYCSSDQSIELSC